MSDWITVAAWGAFAAWIANSAVREALQTRRDRRDERAQARLVAMRREHELRRALARPGRRERIVTLPSGRQMRVICWDDTPGAEVAVRVAPQRLPSFAQLEAIWALPTAEDREPWPDPAVFRAARVAIRALEEPGDRFRECWD